MDSDNIKILLTSNEKIAETSSKGNQEKWFDRDSNRWYKVDQFGYEALAEVLTSLLLDYSNISPDTPFTYVRYQMEQMKVHGVVRTGCSSENFLREDYSIITLSHLYKRLMGKPLSVILAGLSSDKKRIQYLAETTAELTGLTEFPEYLTLLFEVDALVLNDDRHLNNIAVLEHDGVYDYCPIFDNGAGLLSNVQMAPMNIAPHALIRAANSRPLNTTFNRQIKSARALYGTKLAMPRLTRGEIRSLVEPLLEYYPERDRSYIMERVIETILERQKFL